MVQQRLAAKEPSSNLAHISCGPECVHLSAQLLIELFQGSEAPCQSSRAAVRTEVCTCRNALAFLGIALHLGMDV